MFDIKLKYIYLFLNDNINFLYEMNSTNIIAKYKVHISHNKVLDM